MSEWVCGSVAGSVSLSGMDGYDLICAKQIQTRKRKYKTQKKYKKNKNKLIKKINETK